MFIAGFNDRGLVKKIYSPATIYPNSLQLRNTKPQIYSSEFYLRFSISELEAVPYVFPMSDNKLNGSLAWKSMYLELYYGVMTWLTEYHQRSHSESFHSSFKRKNRLLMKIRPIARLNQVMAGIILHNRRRISYFSKLANAS